MPQKQIQNYTLFICKAKLFLEIYTSIISYQKKEKKEGSVRSWINYHEADGFDNKHWKRRSSCLRLKKTNDKWYPQVPLFSLFLSMTVFPLPFVSFFAHYNSLSTFSSSLSSLFFPYSLPFNLLYLNCHLYHTEIIEMWVVFLYFNLFPKFIYSTHQSLLLKKKHKRNLIVSTT